MRTFDHLRPPLPHLAQAAAAEARSRTRSAVAKNPDFIIIGAMKAGTTALFNHLCEQQIVSRPTRREIHYFDLNYSRGHEWYRRHFPPRYAPGSSGVLTGESSPYYILHPHVPARVAATLPAVRLIALLRNPVDRAYSHWAMLARRGMERSSFEDALAREEKTLPQERRRVLADPTHDSWPYRWFSYLARGHYLQQLQTWHARVPRVQMLVVISERLFAEPSSVLPEVTDFLGLPNAGSDTFAAANTGGYHDKMTPSTRDRLVRYFREPNRRLAEYLEIDLDWDG